MAYGGKYGTYDEAMINHDIADILNYCNIIDDFMKTLYTDEEEKFINKMTDRIRATIKDLEGTL